jgi:hypothetical protein
MSLFRWEDIDHTLVSLKLSELVEEMRNREKTDERRIRFDNRGNLNDCTVPSLVLEMKRNHADEGARRTYEIYCEVWEIQGQVKSAAFVRAVSTRRILPGLRARSSAIATDFSTFAGRTSFPGDLSKAYLKGHELHMLRLEDRWRRRLEAEAKICEHIEWRKSQSSQAQAGDTPLVSENPPSSQESSDPLHASQAKPADQAHREAVIRKIQNPQTFTILSTPEAALYFEVQPRTIYRWMDEGKLRRGGRRGSIAIESILKWQKKRSRKRPPD